MSLNATRSTNSLFFSVRSDTLSTRYPCALTIYVPFVYMYPGAYGYVRVRRSISVH
jgi:hypothetical protein